MAYVVVLRRRADRRRFVYKFETREEAQAFATRNRQPMTGTSHRLYSVIGPSREKD